MKILSLKKRQIGWLMIFCEGKTISREIRKFFKYYIFHMVPKIFCTLFVEVFLVLTNFPHYIYLSVTLKEITDLFAHDIDSGEQYSSLSISSPT